MRLVLLGLVLFATAAQVEYVVVRSGAKDYHRAGCSVIRDGKDVLVMSKGEAEAKSLKPHPQCDPNDPRNAAGDAKPAPTVDVFVDGSAYYHREKCKNLKANPRKVTLDEAAKKQWPCRVCKAPVRPRKGRSPVQA